MIDRRRTLELLRRAVEEVAYRDEILAQELEEHADELQLELDRPSLKAPYQRPLRGIDG